MTGNAHAAEAPDAGPRSGGDAAGAETVTVASLLQFILTQDTDISAQLAVLGESKPDRFSSPGQITAYAGALGHEAGRRAVLVELSALIPEDALPPVQDREMQAIPDPGLPLAG